MYILSIISNYKGKIKPKNIDKYDWRLRILLILYKSRQNKAANEFNFSNKYLKSVNLTLVKVIERLYNIKCWVNKRNKVK